jgi:hypothetical protein
MNPAQMCQSVKGTAPTARDDYPAKTRTAGDRH